MVKEVQLTQPNVRVTKIWDTNKNYNCGIYILNSAQDQIRQIVHSIYYAKENPSAEWVACIV